MSNLILLYQYNIKVVFCHVDQLHVCITLDQCSTRRETHRAYFSLTYVYLLPLFWLKPILFNIGYISKRETITKLPNFDVKLNKPLIIIQNQSATTRVRMGPGKPGKSWNFIMAFSRTGKSWKKGHCPWKVLEIC